MKKIVSLILVLVLCSAFFCGCDNAGDKVIRVGASVTPHAEILGAVKDNLAEQGYTLEIVEYNDYVLPNTAVESGELDANYFQHLPYLQDFNEKNGTHLVSVAAVHYEPFGIYAGKSSSLDNIADGATISVPNDGTNEGRALLLLESLGLIELSDDAGMTATVLDIVSNPKNLNITELEAAQLVRSLSDVDFSVINGNYAIEGGLDVHNALAVEDPSSEAAQTYANIIAVKEGHEKDPKVLALIAALQTEEVRQFIEENYDGAVVAIFPKESSN